MLLVRRVPHQEESETRPVLQTRRSCLLVGGGGTGTTHDTTTGTHWYTCQQQARTRAKTVPTYHKERSTATGQVGSPPFLPESVLLPPLGSWPASAVMDATQDAPRFCQERGKGRSCERVTGVLGIVGGLFGRVRVSTKMLLFLSPFFCSPSASCSCSFLPLLLRSESRCY